MQGLREAMNATTNSEAFAKLSSILLMAAPFFIGMILGLVTNS